MVNVSGYTAKEIAAKIALVEGGNPISRGRISHLAKKYQWSSSKIGNTKVYSEFAVDEYIFARLRTNLMREVGQKFDGLWHNDDFDIECPNCGAFAVVNPETEEIHCGQCE